MAKKSSILLVLTPEERNAAQTFVTRRLQAVDFAQLPQLPALVAALVNQIRHVQKGKDRFRGSSDRAGQIMAKLHDSALSGLAELLSECKRVIAAKTRELKEMKREQTDQKSGEGANGEAVESAAEVDAFLVPCPEEEEEQALGYIRDQVQKMHPSDIDKFRVACNELITWWDSEPGQMNGLMVNQFGDPRSPQGRLSIRQKREELRKTVFGPFKALFQELTVQYMKARQEAGKAQREQAP